METGTVRSFRINERGGYGFISTSRGEDLFFQRNDGGQVEPGEPPTIKTWEPVREPQKGDHIYFWRSSNKKGPKAAPWCFKEGWDAAIARGLELRVSYLLGSVQDDFRAAHYYLENQRPIVAREVLTSENFKRDYGAVMEADEALQHAIGRVAKSSYEAKVAALQEYRDSLEQLVADAITEHSRKFRAAAHALRTRFQASVLNGNQGAAAAALRELKSAENKAGLELQLGAAEAEAWLDDATTQLAGMQTYRRFRKTLLAY
ncbi:MAG TPA: hypothetical protein VJC05_01450 [Candidatus Andersenbacteria bacterium]|nr:MAG: hypothetical protein A2854_01760 [Parcubacteria group bacterium RIFCSPHIGHO2_01_FULL_56_18]HLD25693.1 hypothetical protein [Candidatus Andersenbacteria bacterium]